MAWGKCSYLTHVLSVSGRIKCYEITRKGLKHHGFEEYNVLFGLRQMSNILDQRVCSNIYIPLYSSNSSVCRKEYNMPHFLLETLYLKIFDI